MHCENQDLLTFNLIQSNYNFPIILNLKVILPFIKYEAHTEATAITAAQVKTKIELTRIKQVT